MRDTQATATGAETAKGTPNAITRAAALLRQRATDAPASHGTWQVHAIRDPERYGFTHRVISEYATGSGGTGWSPIGDMHEESAAYLATMQPSAARLLADLLDGIAARHQAARHYLDEGSCGYCKVGEWPCPDLADALRLALAILGETEPAPAATQ